ncbi:MAG: Rossman fold protein, TIGR00730 family [Caulobacterales bacterium 32-69-10]|nr:MAG: Rossman fold protein, TIGR00730 family [Caulobacterales bacterium 32-69-10]
MDEASSPAPKLRSVCLFCGSSGAVDPAYLQAAAEFGAALATAGVRLVYGGGGVGLMGAAARGAHEAGGQVLGIMPAFLQDRERVYDDVETVIVRNMHERKRIMFDQSDAFAVFPGGIGTLEEVVELISWRRLHLHSKPIVFLNLKGFWEPFFSLVDHSVGEAMSPPWLPGSWGKAARVADVLPLIRDMIEHAPVDDGEVAAKA